MMVHDMSVLIEVLTIESLVDKLLTKKTDKNQSFYFV